MFETTARNIGEVGDIVGVHTKTGDQFFKVTKGNGLDGPYLDANCLIPYTVPELADEINRNAGRVLIHPTGDRHRNKEFTTYEGAKYRTNDTGSVIRETPKLSKKERRRAQAEKLEQQKSATAEALQ